MEGRTPSPAALVPSFLRLAGHPVRWRLLSALARSDRRVRELCELAGEPQNLVSYHLRQLRDAGLVTSRRSHADGRDSYYALDLRRCSELLAGAGDALHPGLVAAVGRRPVNGVPRRRARVLFLCTGNSGRSQIAEALAQQLSGGGLDVASAGTRPKPLHPAAVQVMRARGIDVAGRRSKHVSEFDDQRFDCVVTVCDRAREACPELPGGPEAIHWSIPDPAREQGTDAQILAAFERLTAELEIRVGFLLGAIGSTPSTEEAHAHA